jgi:hypothetical protein
MQQVLAVGSVARLPMPFPPTHQLIRHHHSLPLTIKLCYWLPCAQAAELEAARKEVATTSKAFMRIQQKRSARFTAAFDHIK